MRGAMLGCIALLIGAGPAAAAGVQVRPGVVPPGPALGRGGHHPFALHGQTFRRHGHRFGHGRHFAFAPFYGYGYGYPLGLDPFYGTGAPSGYGAERVFEEAPRRPMVPVALGIRPQPVGTPTLTVIERGARGRPRAVVYEVGAGAAPPQISGPRIVRVRHGG